MRAFVCYNPGLSRHEMPLRAFATGLEQRGWQVKHLQTHAYFNWHTQPDIVVIFGSGLLGRGSNALYKLRIVEDCKDRNIPYIMLEEGYIKRGEYWSVTVNGLGGDGEYIADELDPNRIYDMTQFKQFRWDGDHILITKQLPRDANVNMEQRAYLQIIQALQYYFQNETYPIRIREHPKKQGGVDPIESVLEDTWLLATYSSNTAVDAVLAGVPVHVRSDKSVVYDLRVDQLNGDLPSPQKQYEVLSQVAHAQWSLEEMEQGQCWDYIEQLPAIQEKVHDIIQREGGVAV